MMNRKASRMPVGLRLFTRQNDLNAGVQAGHRGRLLPEAGIDQHQHPSLGFLDGQRVGEVQHVGPQPPVVPVRRDRLRRRLFREQGRVGYLDDDRVVDLGDLAGGYEHPSGLSAMRRLLQRWDEVRDRLPAATAGNSVPLDGVRLEAPVPDPTKIVAAPVNYRDHKSEMDLTVDISDLAVFLKAPSSIIPHGGVVRLPYSDRRVDQEGELIRTAPSPSGRATATVPSH
jgi:hypothetical protein